LLLETMRDETVPGQVRVYIPSALSKIGIDERSASALGVLINDDNASIWMVRPAIGALGNLGTLSRPSPAAVSSLTKFLEKPRYSEQLEQLGMVSHYRLTAIDALEGFADVRALATLRALTQRGNEPDIDVRAAAVAAVGKIDTGAEQSLMSIFAGEDADVRLSAVVALARYDDDDSLPRLEKRYPAESDRMREAIRDSIKRRGESGSGWARMLHRKLERQEASGVVANADP
jgi:HEAT repeat protein